MAGAAVDAARLVQGSAKQAGVWLAPTSTTLPTTADEALDAAFWTPGYVDENGINIGQNTTSEDITVWQSVSPVKTIITGRELTVGFTMAEWSPETVGLAFDEAAPTETAGAFSMDISSTPAGIEYAVVVDAQDGDTELRFVFPTASLSESGEIAINRTGVATLPVTLKALDASGILATVLRAGS